MSATKTACRTAARLLKAGVPINVVSERLGYSDPGFTMRQYAHVISGMQKDAANRMAELLADALASARGRSVADRPEDGRKGRSGAKRNRWRSWWAAQGSNL